MQDGRIVCIIFKEWSKVTVKKINQLKIAKDLNRHFIEEVIHMANKHMKNISSWEMQMVLQYDTVTHLFVWPKLKRLLIPNIGTLIHFWGDVK